jgi:hypothetical protein
MERAVSIDTGNRTLRNINARRMGAMSFPAEMTLFASSSQALASASNAFAREEARPLLDNRNVSRL